MKSPLGIYTQWTFFVEGAVVKARIKTRYRIFETIS